MNILFTAIVLVLAGVGLFLLKSRLYRPPQGFHAVITRFGYIRRFAYDGQFTLLQPGERVERLIKNAYRPVRFEVTLFDRRYIPVTLSLRVTYRLNLDRLNPNLLRLPFDVQNALFAECARDAVIRAATGFTVHDWYTEEGVATFKRRIVALLQENTNAFGFEVGPNAVLILGCRLDETMVEAAVRRLVAPWQADALRQHVQPVIEATASEAASPLWTTAMLVLSALEQGWMQGQGRGH
nr:SPFH domain-containing protein [Ardenticatena sp.]